MVLRKVHSIWQLKLFNNQGDFMKKFKRILALLVLVAGAALCFCSCSCSKKPVDPVPPDTGGGGGGSSGNLLPGTFSVSVSINGTGGTYLSSTGNEVHA